jgi:hypothetical protein
MSSQTDILNRFRRAYIQFIDELREQFPQETDLIMMRVFFADQVPTVDVANAFILHVLPHKATIEARDEKFFLEHNNLFGMFDAGKVVHFKNLWTSKNLDSDDREVIWKWFDLFCKLVESYKKTLNQSQ